MATKFLEPGGDATFNIAITTAGGFWGTISGSPTVATDFVHGNHLKSIQYAVNALNYTGTPSSTVSDTGSRVSFYIYLNALPSANATVLILRSAANAIKIKITSAGVVKLFETVNEIGTDGPTLSTGVWYRISLAYTITSTTVNRFEVFVDGVSAISVTNATITNTGTSLIRFGNLDGNLTLDFRSSDYYVDDSSTLTDPGNIWVTAKRPNANGTAVEFTTQIGAGGSGYGTGHSPQVNERALSVTNGWSISTTTKKTEQYSIESASTGDINLTGATIIDYMGWIYAAVDSIADSPVHNIIVGGTATAKTMATVNTMFTQVKGSSTYPAGSTDIGMDAQYTTTPHLTSLFECGIIVAYIPGASASSGNFLTFM